MLKAIIEGHAKRCQAMSKSTGLQCAGLAAYGQAVCYHHGASKHHVSGKDHHWYKDGHDTRQKRRDAPKQLKRIKQCDELLNSGEPILKLPFNEPEAKALNKEFERAVKKAVRHALATVEKNIPVTK
jgi:hypothetical protein